MRKFLISILCGLMIFSAPQTTSDQEVQTPQNEIATETEPKEVPVIVPKYKSLGTFKVTAYCSCMICCEENALNRPVDSNGNTIVYGSTGEVLTPQYSIAVDPRVIPYGTEVVFNNGNTYKAQDCGGAIKENRIDLYFSDHQSALNWGVQYHEVFVKNTVQTMFTTR